MGLVRIADAVAVGDGEPLLVVAGPCVVESAELCLEVARRMKEACANLELPYVFKASFDKANRTSISSFRGPGLQEGLAALRRVKEEVGVPVLTDIHLPSQAGPVAEVADVLQIPAFLCRQTDLLVAAGEAGRAVNVKKGQFMSPEEMAHVVGKVTSTGNTRVLLTERGSCFGYQELVVDMRSIVRMRAVGCPVLFDATHSTQRPAALGEVAAAVAAGADGVFLETHPDPRSALSDAATMLPTEEVPSLLARLKAVAAVVREPR
ncbi:MAG: 3-deoxy-8-phosphooctulonate synthase [Planctomycetota bacterium]|jgi:2-dehydro-3-deoxyphosphooctonate aldolase (KDO 8-P synthase)